MNLDELITELNEVNSRRALSDEYLKEKNLSTREDIGIGEYAYGIVMVPVDWVLPHLERLKDLEK